MKTTTKTIHINKTNLTKSKIYDKEVVQNTSIRKNKLKIINTNIKNQKNQNSDKKPKPIKTETERKSLATKFILSEDNTTNDNNNNSNKNPINTNVNIINININNTQPNITNTENKLTDKEFSILLKQKLEEINQIKAQNELKNEKKFNEINNNLNLNLREDEDDLKNLLNSLNLKDINSSINNQSNTYSSIYNNNNSNLFSSIFQESTNNVQRKTFIDVPKNYNINNNENIICNNIINSRPKTSLYQYLGNDIDKYMLMKGERPFNVSKLYSCRL